MMRRAHVSQSNAYLMPMMHIGEVGAVGTTDATAMGYYMVKWLSKPYTLQEETVGMERGRRRSGGNAGQEKQAVVTA